MATQSTPPARPASTPPTTTRRTRQTNVGAHASATPSTGPSQKTASKKPLTGTAKQWAEAEKTIPDSAAAIAFLQKHVLIPEGSHTVSRESLTTGLLHFAFSAPKHARAHEGLIAFAYLAREIFRREDKDEVSRAVDTVVELAGDQIALRLDEHTSNVEEKLEELKRSVEETKKEVCTWTGLLQDATGRVEKAEEALGRAKDGILAARDTQEVSGTLPLSFPPLTLDAAPVRTRRAVALADLLQRQVLVDNVDIPAPDGQPLTAALLQEKGQRALDGLSRPTAPGRG